MSVEEVSFDPARYLSQFNGGDCLDYLEKAETKALGRALAALGFGTQFCAGHVHGEAEAEPAEPAPLGQLRYLESVAQKAGLSEETLEARAMALIRVPVHGLSRREASHLAQIVRGHNDKVSAGAAPGSPRRLAAVPDLGRALHA